MMTNKIYGLFAEYQQPLLQFANTFNGRDFLGISHEVKDDIFGIFPNGYVVKKNHNEYETTVRCYPVFAKRLHYALTSVDIAEDWAVRNKDIYRPLPSYAGLLNYAGLLKDFRFPNIMLLESGDLFATAAGDGGTFNTAASWATARSTSGATAATGNATVGSDILLDGATYYCYRQWTPFDISALGTLATVTAATHSRMPSSKVAMNGNYNIFETTQASPTTLA